MLGRMYLPFPTDDEIRKQQEQARRSIERLERMYGSKSGVNTSNHQSPHPTYTDALWRDSEE